MDETNSNACSQGIAVLGPNPVPPCLSSILPLGSLLPHWRRALPAMAGLGGWRASCRDARDLCNTLCQGVRLELDDDMEETTGKAHLLGKLPNLESLFVNGHVCPMVSLQEKPAQRLATFLSLLQPPTLATLTHLSLHSMVLTQSVLDVIARMECLRELELKVCRLELDGRGSSLDVSVLSACGKLRNITLSSVRSLDKLLPGLAAVSSLRALSLSVSGHRESYVHGKYLAPFTQLTSLECKQVLVTDWEVAALTALNRLVVHTNPPPFATLTSLTCLHLCHLTIADLEGVQGSGMPLKVLGMAGMQGTEGSIQEMVSMVPKSLTRLAFTQHWNDPETLFVESLLAGGWCPQLQSICYGSTIRLPEFWYSRASLWQQITACGVAVSAKKAVLTHRPSLPDATPSVSAAALTEVPVLQADAVELQLDKVKDPVYPHVFSKLKEYTTLMFSKCKIDATDMALLSTLLRAPVNVVWLLDVDECALAVVREVATQRGIHVRTGWITA